LETLVVLLEHEVEIMFLLENYKFFCFICLFTSTHKIIKFLVISAETAGWKIERK
jgi:hypothetical protein